MGDDAAAQVRMERLLASAAPGAREVFEAARAEAAGRMEVAREDERYADAARWRDLRDAAAAAHASATNGPLQGPTRQPQGQTLLR